MLTDHVRVKPWETQEECSGHEVYYPLVFEFKVKFIWHEDGERSLCLWFDAKHISDSKIEARHFKSGSKWIDEPEHVVS